MSATQGLERRRRVNGIEYWEAGDGKVQQLQLGDGPECEQAQCLSP